MYRKHASPLSRVVSIVPRDPRIRLSLPSSREMPTLGQHSLFIGHFMPSVSLFPPFFSLFSTIQCWRVLRGPLLDRFVDCRCWVIALDLHFLQLNGIVLDSVWSWCHPRFSNVRNSDIVGIGVYKFLFFDDDLSDKSISAIWIKLLFRWTPSFLGNNWDKMNR